MLHTTTKPSIFARYREIKKKNEALKATTYSEFLSFLAQASLSIGY